MKISQTNFSCSLEQAGCFIPNIRTNSTVFQKSNNQSNNSFTKQGFDKSEKTTSSKFHDELTDSIRIRSRKFWSESFSQQDHLQSIQKGSWQFLRYVLEQIKRDFGTRIREKIEILWYCVSENSQICKEIMTFNKV